MKKQLIDLSDKACELCLELEKVDVLTDDMYCHYFGRFDGKTQENEILINHYFKANSVKNSMIREIMPRIVKLASELSEEIGNLVENIK